MIQRSLVIMFILWASAWGFCITWEWAIYLFPAKKNKQVVVQDDLKISFGEDCGLKRRGDVPGIAWCGASNLLCTTPSPSWVVVGDNTGGMTIVPSSSVAWSFEDPCDDPEVLTITSSPSSFDTISGGPGGNLEISSKKE